MLHISARPLGTTVLNRVVERVQVRGSSQRLTYCVTHHGLSYPVPCMSASRTSHRVAVPVYLTSHSRGPARTTLTQPEQRLDYHWHSRDGTMGDKGDEGSNADPPFALTDLDRQVLAQTDEEFQKHSWEDIKRIIDTNALDAFKRTPSDLRRYIAWTRGVKAQYGTVTSYILANRLPESWGQPPFTPASTIPFADSSDYKVLINDWPYGTEPGIVHLVVWTRTPIATTPEKGDMTPESRVRIAKFVEEKFVKDLGPGGGDKVVWFKNWVALQSVRALEHFHIMVRDIDDDTLERWSGERPRRGADGRQISSVS